MTSCTRLSVNRNHINSTSKSRTPKPICNIISRWVVHAQKNQNNASLILMLISNIFNARALKPLFWFQCALFIVVHALDLWRYPILICIPSTYHLGWLWPCLIYRSLHTFYSRRRILSYYLIGYWWHHHSRGNRGEFPSNPRRFIKGKGHWTCTVQYFVDMGFEFLNSS